MRRRSAGRPQFLRTAVEEATSASSPMVRASAVRAGGADDARPSSPARPRSGCPSSAARRSAARCRRSGRSADVDLGPRSGRRAAPSAAPASWSCRARAVAAPVGAEHDSTACRRRACARAARCRYRHRRSRRNRPTARQRARRLRTRVQCHGQQGGGKPVPFTCGSPFARLPRASFSRRSSSIRSPMRDSARVGRPVPALAAPCHREIRLAAAKPPALVRVGGSRCRSRVPSSAGRRVAQVQRHRREPSDCTKARTAP